MFVKKTVCNKCGCELGTHPDKITLSKSVEKDGFRGQKIRTYKTTATLHLCDKCRKEFNEFMNIEGDTEQ